MKKRIYILENKAKGIAITAEMVKLLVPESETSGPTEDYNYKQLVDDTILF